MLSEGGNAVSRATVTKRSQRPSGCEVPGAHVGPPGVVTNPKQRTPKMRRSHRGSSGGLRMGGRGIIG